MTAQIVDDGRSHARRLAIVGCRSSSNMRRIKCIGIVIVLVLYGQWCQEFARSCGRDLVRVRLGPAKRRTESLLATDGWLEGIARLHVQKVTSDAMRDLHSSFLGAVVCVVDHSVRLLRGKL